MELELERFLTIRSLDPNTSPSSLIDEAWHDLILQTNKYKKYCLEKFGFIVHHSVLDSLDQEKRKDRLRNTYKMYSEMFGTLNNDLWETNECKICGDLLEKCYFPHFNCCQSNNYCNDCVKKLDNCPDCKAYEFTNKKFITVKTAKIIGQELKIGINNKATVDELINICSSIFNVTPRRIIFAGHQLYEGRTLWDYNITHKSVIHVLF